MAGLFIVFEGGDATGKSTQSGLLAQRLVDAGRDVVLTREPGGTKLGERVRNIVLDPASGDVSPLTETLLYAADKAQHVHEVVRPALRAGAIVVSDRYVDSTIAYQGAGRGLDVGELERVARWATGDLRPDLTVLFDIDPSQAVARKSDKDRLEAAGDDFHRQVRDAFLALAARDPERYLVLPALADVQWTHEQVWQRVQTL